ncbi:hypothetical protein L6212_23300, partial [Pseudomonas syringae pv. syringae]|nr:hypothetical protein [Pseudomonas syringae pv. syringae]
RCKISGWVWRPKEKTKIRSIAKQQILSACMSRYGGCAREIFGSAGVCLFARFANLHTAATQCLATIRGGSR